MALSRLKHGFESQLKRHLEPRELASRHPESRLGPPIGGMPEDEYDSYAARLASMVVAGPTDDLLLKYLHHVEVYDMRLAANFDPERTRNVVAAIRALVRRTPSHEGRGFPGCGGSSTA